MPPQATLDLYRSTQRRSLSAVLGVRRLWGQIDPAGDWGAQWSRMMPFAVALVGSAQIGAASDGAASVEATLRQSGHPETPAARVVPAALAGWVSDPASGTAVMLDKALVAPLIHAREASGSPVEMLAAGRARLESLAQVAVSDASRHAVSVQGVSTSRVVATWYEPPPYCQRCAILIGKRVKITTQFRRHPRCDGQVQTMHERDWSDLPEVQPSQITDLTEAQRRAIEDGADMGRVINAHRKPARGRRGSTVQGYLSRKSGQRPTPAAIYDYADRNGLTRAELADALRRTGYITGDPKVIARLAA